MLERGEYGLLFMPLAGMLQEFSDTYQESYAAEAPVAFGIALKAGTDPEVQVLPWGNSAIDVPVIGISLVRKQQASDRYEATDTVRVLKKGKVFVSVVADVVAGQPAYVRAGAGTFTNVAQDNLRVGKFRTTAANGTVAVLEIDLRG